MVEKGGAQGKNWIGKNLREMVGQKKGQGKYQGKIERNQGKIGASKWVGN